jgi:hypothetical protein
MKAMMKNSYYSMKEFLGWRVINWVAKTNGNGLSRENE